MTREEAIKRIKYHKIVHKMDEPRAIYISEALDMATQSLVAWDEIINHLEDTAKELLDREDEKQSHAFAKGITFAVSMIKNHMKEVEGENEMHYTFTDAEIAKSFIEDVEAVKDLLPRKGETNGRVD